MTTTLGTRTLNKARTQRVAAGLCAACGEPRESYAWFCNRHAADARRLRQRRKSATKATTAAAATAVAPETRETRETREDTAHEPPTPVTVAVAMRSPARPSKPIGPGPRSTFSIGESVSWWVILPGIGANGVAQRVQLTGRVVAIDTTQTRPNYIVRHQPSGAEFRRPANELVLAQVESEVAK